MLLYPLLYKYQVTCYTRTLETVNLLISSLTQLFSPPSLSLVSCTRARSRLQTKIQLERNFSCISWSVRVFSEYYGIIGFFPSILGFLHRPMDRLIVYALLCTTMYGSKRKSQNTKHKSHKNHTQLQPPILSTID